MKDLNKKEYIELFESLHKLLKEFNVLYDCIYEFQTRYAMPKHLSETLYECQDHIEDLKKDVLAELGYLQIIKHDSE